MRLSRRSPYAPFASLRASRGRRLSLATVALVLAASGAAWAVPGALTQLEDEDACVSHTGSDGSCFDGWALQDPTGLAITRNGKHLYVAATGGDSVVLLRRNPLTGALTQPEAPEQSCVSANGTGGLCTAAATLVGPVAVAVSPDSKFLYVAAQTSNAVTAFKRNPLTGALTSVAVTGGCVSETGSGGACVDAVALDRPYSIAITPDGNHLYVASETSYAVAAFKRNKLTGALTQLAGTAACTSDGGTGGACVDGRALREARWVSVSPDGRHVYVAAEASDAVAVFARNRTTGALTQVAGAGGCVSNTGLDGAGGPCADGRAMNGPVALAVSPDNKHVYVASLASGAVSAFVRNRTTGALTQVAGAAGCANESGSDGCAAGAGLAGARGVAVSQDGKHVYVAAQSGNAVAVFSRNRLTGGLTQLEPFDGCVTEDGHADCNFGVGLLGARAVVVSRDNKNVYVGSFTSDAVAAFKRARQ